MNSTKNTLLAVLALATVGGALLAWKQYGELIELRAAALDRTAREDFQKRISDLEKQNRELQDRLAARGRRGPGGEAGPAGTGEPGEGAGSGGPGGLRGRFGDPRQADAAMRELMAKPEVQALMAQQQKAVVEGRYAALFKSLNLTPEQAEKLKTLLADRMNTGRDVAEAARAQGIDPRENRDTFAKLLSDAQATLDNSIKSVIGEQGYAQLQSYEQTMPQRSVVEQLQRQLAYGDTPLTAQQSEQLVQILAANAPQRTAGDSSQPSLALRGPDVSLVGGMGPGSGGPAGVVMIGGPAGSTATVTANAIAQAQAVLSASQVAALQQIQQQQATQQQLQQVIRSTLSTQQPGSAGTATGTTPTGQGRPKG